LLTIDNQGMPHEISMCCCYYCGGFNVDCDGACAR
jgi:hypothetical protein